jgi:GMP synthase-like glutamine amidotransferase
MPAAGPNGSAFVSATRRMAQAFGGSAIKSPNGWGIGLHRYDLLARASWMDDSAAVAAPASHQDQVVSAPSDARVIASSAFTPYAGLYYGDAISFQFHPEFSRAFAAALIDSKRERYPDLVASAIQSHLQPDDCARVGRWIGRFLDSGERSVFDGKPSILGPKRV